MKEMSFKFRVKETEGVIDGESKCDDCDEVICTG